MSNIVDFKIESDEISVQYEVITTADISSPMTEERARIMSQLSDIDHCLAENQAIIDKLDAEINRLTNHADGIDYTIAVASGIISGLIDSFFVGEFSLDNATQWGKEKVDSFVKSIANKQGYKGDTLSGAVSFLEEKFPIPADSATNLFGGGLQHHLRDFSHHPTPIGLIFSLLTQFTKKVYGTNTLGAFIVADVPSTDLIGKDLPSKFAIGFTSWIFHMISDISGSSGSIAKGKYGTGLPGPFVSLLKELSSLPFFSHKENNNNFCVWISKLFNGTLLGERDKNGKLIPESIIKFDLRTEIGIAHELGRQAIPVIINECIVRISYFVRRLIGEFKNKKISNFHDFIHKIDWQNTLPFNNRTIVRMMTIAKGTFAAVDMADAGIRAVIKSGGFNPAALGNFVLNVNIVCVGRFAIAVATDVGMGVKKGIKENNRLDLVGQQLQLMNVKVSYQLADMWVSAKDAGEAINEAYKMVVPAVETIVTTWAETDKKVDDIVNTLEKENEEYAVLETFLTMYDESQG